MVKESISASGGAATHPVSRERPETPNDSSTSLKNPAPYLSRNIGSSSRSLPLAATTTKLNITSNASSIPNDTLTRNQEVKGDELVSKERNLRSVPGPDKVAEKDDLGTVREEQLGSQDTPIKGPESDGKPISYIGTGRDSSSWLGWFSKASQSNGQNLNPVQYSQGDGQATNAFVHEASSLSPSASQDGKPSQDPRRNSDPNPVAAATHLEQRSRPWLSLWSTTNTPSEKSTTTPATKTVGLTPSQEVADTTKSEQDIPRSTEASQPSSQSHIQTADTAKSQGWSFWSKDRSKDDHTTNTPKEDVGKLALAGSPHKSPPESAVIDQTKGLPNKLGKREWPQSLEATDIAGRPDGLKGEVERHDNTKATKIFPKVKPPDQIAPTAQKIAANLLLPPFKRTYRVVDKPSIMRHLSRILQYTQVADMKHLDLIPNPPRIKSALAIVSMPQKKRNASACGLTHST